jgi:hypothetical protein
MYLNYLSYLMNQMYDLILKYHQHLSYLQYLKILNYRLYEKIQKYRLLHLFP